jgi:hypothetical protein
VTAARVEDDPRRGLLGVSHHSDQHRALIVTHPGDRHIQQRVEQLALALLELADDHHPDEGVGDSLPRRGKPRGEIAAVVEVGDAAGVIE